MIAKIYHKWNVAISLCILIALHMKLSNENMFFGVRYLNHIYVCSLVNVRIHGCLYGILYIVS